MKAPTDGSQVYVRIEIYKKWKKWNEKESEIQSNQKERTWVEIYILSSC